MLLVSVLVYSRLFVYFYPVYRIVHLLMLPALCTCYRIVHLLSSIYLISYLLCELFIL